MNTKSDVKKLEEIPLDGSLGLLATGDLGFVAWRAVKVKNRVKNKMNKDKEE